jgi:dTDP-4-amino-4,6-dideoxygalactose transaminase
MIPHSKPTIIEKKVILENIKKILNAEYLSENIFVEKFEQKVCRFFKTKYAIAVSSGTSALHLALLALGVDENSEVIIPSFTCAALLNAILYIRAKPVIVDVDLDDFNIDFKEVKKYISKKTKAIIVPHMFGYPAKNIKEIIELGIPVIEDTTQSIGAKIDGEMVGKFGIINVLSFYATKLITTFGEGGIILTNNKKIYSIIKDLKEYDKKRKFKLRYNYKLSEVQAIMGLQQIEKIEYFVNRRRKLFEYYKNRLKNCKNIKIFEPLKNTEPVFYRFIIQITDKENIDEIIANYKKFDIEVAKPIFLPLDKYYYGKFICKNSELLYNTTLSLPIYPSLNEKEVNYISKITKKILK